jgi:ABC-type transport system involved in multi-copper enzyme maturation permease subunit
MFGTTKAELTKVARRISTWVLIGILLLLLIGLQYLLGWYFTNHPPPGARFEGVSRDQLRNIYHLPNSLRQTLGSLSGPGGAIGLILGGLAAGSEYSWGTMKTLFTQRPGRLTVLAAKIVGLAVTLAVVVLLLFAAGMGTSYVLTTVDGAATTWPSWEDMGRALGAAWLVTGVWTAIGFALATSFRSTALAIGIGLVYMLLLEVLVINILSAFSDTDLLRGIKQALPGQNVSFLVQSFGSAIQNPAAGRLAPGQRTPLVVSGAQATWVLVAYTAGAMVLSAALVRRRDITS